MDKTNSTKHGNRFIDLAGQTFGHWYVMKYHSTAKAGHIRWLCRCKCGTKQPVVAYSLTSGGSRSCRKCGHTTHGMIGSLEYKSWVSMLSRCRNPAVPNYHRYGGRGIRVCRRWMSFENFLADMGPRPSLDHSIERVDNDGNYGHENCRWATRKDQGRNKHNNVMLTHDGRTMCVSEWAEEWAEVTGISMKTLKSRLRYGWSVERILTTPVRGYNR